MAYKLNEAAVEKAQELIVKGRIDDGPWLPSFDNWDAAQILGVPDPDNPDVDPDVSSTFGLYFLGIFEGEDGAKTEHYAYPFARLVTVGEEPRVFLAALKLIRAQAGMMGETDIFLAANNLLSLAGLNLSAQFKAGDVESIDPDGWWVEVLAEGTWTGSLGGTKEFDGNDLSGIVQTFKETFPDVKPVLRLGDHPELKEGTATELPGEKDLKPAVGQVMDLKVAGKKLLGYFTNVPKLVKDAIQNKMFNQVSAGFWRDFRHGEKVHPYLLNHVAILGAELPAVSGLADLGAYMASANDSLGSVVCFTQTKDEEADMATNEELQKKLDGEKEKNVTLTTERDGLKTENETLQGQNAEFSKKQIESEVEGIVDEAIAGERLLPKNKENEMATGIALRSASVNLKKDEDDPFENWKKGLEERGKVLDFKEKASVGEEAKGGSDDDEEMAAGAAAAEAAEKRHG